MIPADSFFYRKNGLIWKFGNMPQLQNASTLNSVTPNVYRDPTVNEGGSNGENHLESNDLSAKIDLHNETDHDLIGAVLEHCWWRASSEGNMLTVKTRGIRARTEIVTAQLIYCLRHSSFIFLLYVATIYQLSYSLAAINMLLIGTFPWAQVGNISIEGSRMKAGALSPLAVSSLKLHTACSDERSNESVEFSDPVAIYGFTVNFNNSDFCQNEFAYFRLYDLQGKSRRPIGASGMRWASGGVRLLTFGVDACDGAFSFDLAPPWPWHFADESALFLFLSASYPLFAAILATAGRPHDAQRSAAALMLVAALPLLIAIAGYASVGSAKNAVYPAVLFVAHIVVALPLAASHPRIPEYMMGAAILALVGRAVNDCVIFDDCQYLLVRPPIATCLGGVLGCILSARARAMLATTRARLIPALFALDRVWAGFVGVDANRDALEDLRSLAESLGQVLDCPPPRQLCPAPLSLLVPENGRQDDMQSQISPLSVSVLHSHSSEPVDEMHEESATVVDTQHCPAAASLDQLYSQALCTAPLLHAACTVWASECGGWMGHAAAAGAPSSTDELDPDLDGLPEALRRWIRARVIKAPARTAAKAAACYGGDVSRVLDVTRCRIVCRDAAGLVRGLRAVCESPMTGLVRVRNALCDGLDMGTVVGLRAVTINLCLTMAQARRLSVDNHVCEVQLVPEALEAEFGRWPHARFLAMRDLRVGGRLPLEPCLAVERAYDSASSIVEAGRTGTFAMARPSVFEAEDVGRPGLACFSSGLGPAMLPLVWRVALTVYLRFARGRAGALDRRARDYDSALKKSSSYSVLFSSKPYAAYISRPAGKIRSMIVAGLLFSIGVYNCRAAILGGRGELGGALVRVRVLSPVSQSSQQPSWFGLLQDGCAVSVSPANEATVVASGAVSGQALANGYRFLLPRYVLGEGAVRWVVEASDENGINWWPICACTWVSVRFASAADVSGVTVEAQSEVSAFAGEVAAFADCLEGSVSLSLEALNAEGANYWAVVSLNSYPATSWATLGFLLLAMGWLCALVTAALGYVDAYVPTLSLSLSAWVGWSLACETALIVAGTGWSHAGYVWVRSYTLPAAWCAVGFFCLEKRYVPVLIIAGLLFDFNYVLVDILIYRGKTAAAISGDWTVAINLFFGAYLIASGGVMYLMRRRALRRAHRLVESDRILYDRVWAHISGGQAAECSSLKEQVLVALPVAVGSAFCVGNLFVVSLSIHPLC